MTNSDVVGLAEQAVERIYEWAWSTAGIGETSTETFKRAIERALLTRTLSMSADHDVLEVVARAIDDALPESDSLSLAPSQIRRAARAAIEAYEQAALSAPARPSPEL